MNIVVGHQGAPYQRTLVFYLYLPFIQTNLLGFDCWKTPKTVGK